jgi:hypothetical protein
MHPSIISQGHSATIWSTRDSPVTNFATGAAVAGKTIGTTTTNIKASATTTKPTTGQQQQNLQQVQQQISTIGCEVTGKKSVQIMNSETHVHN